MTPSVEGWRKVRVAAVLALAAAGSGALAGFAAGVLWAATGLARLTAPWVVSALLLTAAADILYWWTGVPRPLSVRRQVPVLWGRLFGPETVALLYGARLGAGPLTILTTWSWWTAMVLAASAGLENSIAIGGLFGVTRVVHIVVAGEWAQRSMAYRMGDLVRRQVVASVLVVATYLLLLPIAARIL